MSIPARSFLACRASDCFPFALVVAAAKQPVCGIFFCLFVLAVGVVCARTPGGRECTGQQCHYILWLLFAGLGRGARLPWKPMSPVVLVLRLSRCAWLRSWWFW